MKNNQPNVPSILVLTGVSRHRIFVCAFVQMAAPQASEPAAAETDPAVEHVKSLVEAKNAMGHALCVDLTNDQPTLGAIRKFSEALSSSLAFYESDAATPEAKSMFLSMYQLLCAQLMRLPPENDDHEGESDDGESDDGEPDDGEWLRLTLRLDAKTAPAPTTTAQFKDCKFTDETPPREVLKCWQTFLNDRGVALTHANGYSEFVVNTRTRTMEAKFLAAPPAVMWSAVIQEAKFRSDDVVRAGADGRVVHITRILYLPSKRIRFAIASAPSPPAGAESASAAAPPPNPTARHVSRKE